MAAAQVLRHATWTQAQVGHVQRRPSWLAPARRPSVAPSSVRSGGPSSVRSASIAPKLTSMPPSDNGKILGGGAEIAALRAELQRRDDELTAMAGELDMLRA